ncbi:DUF3696 domain-containing protein [Aliarcobacter cryaerophilus]|uniref:DUF3696 domain-containing protein n=1 Tax=Aliarcobacter cryaerophilus TaxID=28198 RepID=UPI0021B30730|nr:DUF3696 domain-containing protein [Aliarcobacter cryaerophilus]MCT7444111.1 DUF3696 domain-containing protein [Aliarcobacter cryaerophilus]MCT7478401.1 DUF3696 domain-containing protein [Aliarcobacter cryaerophilus]
MRSLTIKNFKCFDDKRVNFRNLTVLAGGNGAGKSTVIQSILLFAQSFEKNSDNQIPVKLFLNDYYCELGSSERLNNEDSDKELIEFIFEDNNNKSVTFKYEEDENDSNILKIRNLDNVIDEKKGTNVLNFLHYFDFIGADRFGPRTFHHTDKNFSMLRVGKLGEYTALVLDKYKWIRFDDESGDLLLNVNNYMSEIFGFIRVNSDFIKNANIAMLEIKNHPKLDFQSPVNMPYGVSYVLPIIVSCLVRQLPKNKLLDEYSILEENELIIIENPEAHLHPSAQSKLGYFLAKMSKKVQIIVETHSEHIINGIRLATLENVISNDDVIINFLERKESEIEPEVKEINLNQLGDLSDWPKGFFDQQALDSFNIIKAKSALHVSK